MAATPTTASASGWLVCMILLSASASAAEQAAADYARDIKPLLKHRCYACHGALKQKGGLRLDTAAAVREGGDSGPATVAAHALLIERVTTADEKERMPPEGEGSALTKEEVAKLSAWIAAGAPGPADERPEADPRDHWAYQPPKASGRSIDQLIAARLAENKLKPQAAASPEVWLRRVFVDLAGVPPSPEELRSFLSETRRSQGTHEIRVLRKKVIDRLLASPQYGERWGRHFMDIWRYCDWYGLGDQLRHSQKHIWHWRDWIIESLNADKGYDRMIVEMLAADELAPEDRGSLRATGFLARSYYLFNRTTWLDETIEHTCRAFLGITMQCVKCHSHKYDPIEQPDYYAMRAIFEPLHVRLDPWPGEADLARNGLPRVFDLHLSRPTYRHIRGDEKNEDKSKAIPPGIPGVLAFAAFKPAAVSLPETSSRPASLPFVLSDQLAAADREFDEAQRKNDAAAMKAASLRTAMIQAAFAADQAAAGQAIKRAAALAEARYKAAKAEVELAKAMADTKAKDAAKRIKAAEEALAKARTAVKSPGEKHTSLRVTDKALEGPDEKNAETVQKYPAASTGRRLAFAKWIADARNPLTARVLVNHVWLRHFGAPIVADVSDFGRRSPAPPHQDALDSLAAGFMRNGWSLKWLHRQMVLSDLYARSSSGLDADPHTIALDPDNAFLWRMNPRRLESQAVRDCLLSIAGRLDPAMSGPDISPEKAESSPRRSLYFTQTADVEHRFLATFDNSNVLECYRRGESVVPQQALALSNSKLSRECADSIAAKLKPLSEAEFIQQAFITVLSRGPSSEETLASRDGLAALKGNRALFLQALMNHNDFVTLR